MPQQVPDNDITFVYVKDLSESIRSVGNIMQSLTGELHTHAVSIHTLDEKVATFGRNVDYVVAVVRDGVNGRPSLIQMVANIEHEIQTLKVSRDDERRAKEESNRKLDEERKSAKTFRQSVYVAIIAAVLGLVGQVYTWVSKKLEGPPPTPPQQTAPVEPQ